MIPQNIKAIGNPEKDSDTRIYISKKVHRKVYNFSKLEKSLQTGGVFIGNVYTEDGINHIVIRNFIIANDTESTKESISFTKETWAQIDDEKKRYPESQMVGWMHTNPDGGVVATEDDEFFQTHIFRNSHSILHIVDPLQVVETYYYLEGDKLVKAKGFYVYNENRQNEEKNITTELESESAVKASELKASELKASELKASEPQNAPQSQTVTKPKERNTEVIELFVDDGVEVPESENIYQPTFEIKDSEPEEIWEEVEKPVKESEKSSESKAATSTVNFKEVDSRPKEKEPGLDLREVDSQAIEELKNAFDNADKNVSMDRSDLEAYDIEKRINDRVALMNNSEGEGSQSGTKSSKLEEITNRNKKAARHSNLTTGLAAVCVLLMIVAIAMAARVISMSSKVNELNQNIETLQEKVSVLYDNDMNFYYNYETKQAESNSETVTETTTTASETTAAQTSTEKQTDKEKETTKNN